MDWFWFLDAPFWQKMYFITMAAGVAIFLTFISEITKEVKDNWKELKQKFHKEIEKQKEALRKRGWKI